MKGTIAAVSGHIIGLVLGFIVVYMCFCTFVVTVEIMK